MKCNRMQVKKLSTNNDQDIYQKPVFHAIFGLFKFFFDVLLNPLNANFALIQKPVN